MKEIINKTKFKKELPDFLKKDESLITDPVEISNKFNEYSINVGPKLANKIHDNNGKFTKFLGGRSVNYLSRCSHRKRSRK